MTITLAEKLVSVGMSPELARLLADSGVLTDTAVTLAGTDTMTGAKTFTNTVTVGVDGTGKDVTFYGDTASAKLLWDESADSLLISGPAATALAVGLTTANPAFVVDASTGSQAAGLKVTGATAAGTVAVAAISSGGAANLTVNAKGTGTIGIGSVSTGAVTITPATTVTGVITPTGGVAAAGGFTLLPMAATGENPAMAAADGTDATPVATEFYWAQVNLRGNSTVTGVAHFNGSVASGNIKVGLADSSGNILATSVSTAMSGTDTYQKVPFTAPYAAKGPATYYVVLFVDNGTARVNTHVVGGFITGKKTGEVYATGFTAFTPGTTFTTALGPIATLY